MATEDHLLKIYSDRIYQHTTTARHQGTTLAFAMDGDRRVVYSVLDLSIPDAERGEVDVAYWSENPLDVPFPTEIAQVGYAAAGATAVPVVKRGGRIEAEPDDQLDPDEIDPFLSSTARLSALAPFQVLSDGTYVIVLRQAIDDAHDDAVFALTGGGSSGDPARGDYVHSAGARVPVVSQTLLVDRFLLVDGKLLPVREVRYRRSRNKSLPGSAKDSLGAEDMDGVPFLEPTQELAFVRNLTDGRFTAVLVPTAVTGANRWQIFAHNSATGRVDGFNIEQSGDGLFNTRGTRFYTSPDPDYRSAVYERDPGTCPFTGAPLVPVVDSGGAAETALHFDGSSYLDLGIVPALDFSAGYTIEAWVKPDAYGGHIVARYDTEGAGDDTEGAGAYALGLRADGSVFVGHAHAPRVVGAPTPLPRDRFSHVAATFDGTTAMVFVDGVPVGQAAMPMTAAPAVPVRIGAATSGDRAGSFFTGLIDEVRVWDRPRTAADFAEDRQHRLVGNEPGLVAYYRLDEGSGLVAHDQTDNALNAAVIGGAQWVTSGAPVGDHPGVRRDSFSLVDRDVVSGLSSVLYYQQEDMVSGHDRTAKPAKSHAKVLVAGATVGAGEAVSDTCVSVIDLGVGADGRLAQIPDHLALPVLARPEAAPDLDAVSAAEQQVFHLRTEITNLNDRIGELNAEIAGLNDVTRARDAAAAEINRLQAIYDANENDLTKWRLRFEFKAALNGIGEQYIAVEGDSLASHALLVRSTSLHSGLWTLERYGTYDNYPAYLVRNELTGGYMHIVGGYTNDGVDAIQFHRDTVANELFGIVPSSELPGYHYLAAKHCGRVITGLDSAGLNGTQLVQWKRQTYPQQSALSVVKVSMLDGTDTALAAAQDTRAVRQAELDALSVAMQQVAELQQTLTARQADLAAALDRLARMTGGDRGATDVTVEMPTVALDRTGLSTAGGTLSFARGADTPTLLDSATGAVALYFRGANDQFFATYLDTAVTRAAKVLATPAGAVTFTAKDPGIEPDLLSVTVAEDRTTTLCTITLAGGPHGTEVWEAVPRNLSTLAAVLGGDGGTPTVIGIVAAIGSGELRLATGASIAIASGSHIQVGGHGFLVAGEQPAGATILPLAGATPGAVAAVGDEVSLVRYDYRWASSGVAGVTLTGGSRLVSITAAPGGAILDGTASALLPAVATQWRGDMPGRAYSFGGEQYLSLPTDHLDRAGTGGDTSVEAWVWPARVNGTSRLVHANTQVARYSLALTEATLLTAIVLDGVDDAHDDDTDLDLGDTDFTIELWLQHVSTRRRAETAVLHGPEAQRVSLGFTAGNAFSFTIGSETLTTASYPDQDWHHWAVTFEWATRTQVIYRDGTEVARGTAGTGAVAGRGALRLANVPGSSVFLQGAVDELRVFTRVRSVGDIDGARHNRLSGREPGLALYRTFPGPAAGASPIKGYQVVAGVGGTFARSRESFAVGNWTHLAMTYRQSWAVRLDGGAYLDAGADDSLNVVGDLTVEAFVKLDRIGTRQGLLSKGRLADGTRASLPYQLSIRPDGTPEFAFEEDGTGAAFRYAATTSLQADTFHTVAVVREYRQTNPTADQPDIDRWYQITFYVDGAAAGSYQYRGPGPKGNTGPLEIGRGRDGATTNPATGVVGEVRLWTSARAGDQIGAEVDQADKGLLARWRFEENTGNSTDDTTGAYRARLRRAQWTTDPDPRASVLTLYRDGEPVACDPLAVSDAYGNRQLTLGARLVDGAATDALSGVLEEVRVWRVVRTQEQVLDNLFTRLKGEREDLVAYWPFDRDSTTPDAERVTDQGLRGNHLVFGDAATRPKALLSTAPVSNDAALVRSALAAVHTPFHDTVSASPSVSEYADMQRTDRGEATGVLKRCYSYLRDGHWHLLTGYKIGNLATEWVAQVQFDPRLVGYVEGAPPVPSENLTDSGDSDHNGVSSVEFVETDDVVDSLSSSKERSVNAALSTELSEGASANLFTVVAPLGFGYATQAADVDLHVSGGASLEYTNGWNDETSVSQGQTRTQSMAVSLSGHWEDPAHVLNTALGRRFVPANTGFALVQSETADVFALRLAHTGALVAYRMSPNPDIPKDWNIISFPINPRYTKQGTLDGTVGFDDHGKVCDLDYPTATGYGEYSYYKPREAYALKRRIDRARQQARAFYKTVSTETHRSDPTGEQALKVLSAIGGVDAPEAAAPSSGEPATAHQDLVNTYVWTAAGGFFAETTDYTDAVSTTTSGTYSVTGEAHLGFEFQMKIFGAQLTTSLTATMGGGYTVTRAKSRDASRSFGLSVTCSPSGDLQKYTDGFEPVYDDNGTPVIVPGKVDAYRLMSYYLGESGGHFDDFYNKVVDPLWLNQSNDPDAAALRGARQSGSKPPCWRILHRVTFISRVLPAVPPPGAPPVEQAMRLQNIDSNYELVKRLEPYVRTATTQAELAEATHTALAVHLPELLPHTDTVTRYLSLYYGMTE